MVANYLRASRLLAPARMCLILLTLAAATVPICMWAWRVARIREAVNRIEAVGGSVSFSDCCSDDGCAQFPPEHPGLLSWLGQHVGREWFFGVARVSLVGTQAGDEELESLSAFAGTLKFLDLRGTRVTDDGLRWLSRLKYLRSLWLDRTKVTDRGLDFVAALEGVRDVGLDETAVTRAGFERLRRRVPGVATSRSFDFEDEVKRFEDVVGPCGTGVNEGNSDQKRDK
jgi:hypothetical protein